MRTRIPSAQRLASAASLGSFATGQGIVRKQVKIIAASNLLRRDSVLWGGCGGTLWPFLRRSAPGAASLAGRLCPTTSVA